MGTVELDAAEAAAIQARGDCREGVDEPLDVGGGHDVGNRPAQGIRLSRYAHGRTGRVPELLPARMPELTHQASACLCDERSRAPEARLVRIIVSRDDGAMSERLRIDRDDLGHEESRPSPGARHQEVYPAIRDPMPGAVVRERRRKRDAIAELTLANTKR